MRDAETCQYFLEAVLNIKIRHIEYIDKQKDLSDSYDAHGIRLDVYAEDDAGIVYNVEVQNRRESFKRIRYYQSGMDRRLLEKGVREVVEDAAVLFFEHEDRAVGKLAVGI